jgi:hypothetical protein
LFAQCIRGLERRIKNIESETRAIKPYRCN